MVIKVYISGISGNHEIRKRQQRVLFVLSSLRVPFEEVDITERGREGEREEMREKVLAGGKSSALPPQIFRDEQYLGDFVDFDAANEEDRLMEFLQISSNESETEIQSQCLSNVETGESEALKA